MTGAVVPAVVATALAVSGAALGLSLAQFVRAKLELLVHIATGALLGITAFDILPEAKAVLIWPTFIIAIVAGYGLLWVIGAFVFYVCPSCAISEMDESSAMARKGSLILLASALGVHCLLDGIAIATGNQLSMRAEAGALVGVGLHKLPEGLALGLLLAGARYSRTRAILVATAIESLTIVGGLGGMLMSHRPGPTITGIVFAVVGGGFVYLVYNAFGGAFKHGNQLSRAKSLTAEAVSFVLTGLLFCAITKP